ncbi:MAG: hypothetical protein WAL88_06115, partial [Nitrosotalea sp.]
PERAFDSPDFNAEAPKGVTILGWSKLDDVRTATLRDGWRHLVPGTARDLASLIIWIQSGQPPA